MESLEDYMQRREAEQAAEVLNLQNPPAFETGAAGETVPSGAEEPDARGPFLQGPPGAQIPPLGALGFPGAPHDPGRPPVPPGRRTIPAVAVAARQENPLPLPNAGGAPTAVPSNAMAVNQDEPTAERAAAAAVVDWVRQQQAPPGNAGPPFDPADQRMRAVGMLQGAPVPGGIHGRLVGPTDPDDVPEFKAYTSSRHWTTAVAKVHFPSSRLQVEFMKTISKKNFGTSDLELLRPASIDVSELLPPDSELAWRARAPQRVDLRHLVYGTLKGVIRTARVVGRVLHRDTSTRIADVLAFDWGRQTIAIAPVYAPSVALVTDEQALKAQRSVVTAFVEAPTHVRDIGRVTLRCGELLNRGVNTVRFVFRLAAMYVYARFAAAGTGAQVLIAAAAGMPEIVDVTSWNTWAAEVTNAPRAHNYVPWTPPRRVPDEFDARYLALLALACCDSVAIGPAGGETAPPIIWPRIDHVRLLGSFAGAYAFQEVMVTDAAFVFTVATAWCIRYSTVALLTEAIQFLATLYWAGPSGNLTLGYHQGEISLPQADMTAYLLAPLLEDCDKLKTLVLSDYKECPHKLMVESGLQALLVGFCRSYQQYYALDGPLERGILATPEDEEDAFSILTRFSPEQGAPIWMSTQETWKALGLKGELGRCFSSLAVLGDVREYKRSLRGSVSMIPSSYDVLGFLRRIPEDTAVAGWVGALPPATELQPNMDYMLEDLSKMGGAQKMLRGLTELADVTGIAVLAARNAYAVRSYVIAFRKYDDRGYPRDHQLGGATLPDGSQLRMGLRITSLGAATLLNDKTHDRYNLEWYSVPYIPDRQLSVKPMDGLLRDPRDPTLQFRTARHESRAERERLARLTDGVARLITGHGAPRPHLGDTRDDSDSDGPSDAPIPPHASTPASSVSGRRVATRRGGAVVIPSPRRADAAQRPAQPTTPPNWPAYVGRSGAGTQLLRPVQAATRETPRPRSPPLTQLEEHAYRYVTGIDEPTESTLSERWNYDTLRSLAHNLPNHLYYDLHCLDNWIGDNDVAATWLEKLFKVVGNAMAFRMRTVQGMARAPGVLALDFDVINTWSIEILMDMAPLRRSNFLRTVIGLLENVRAAYTTQEAMVGLEQFLGMLNVAANHLAGNPYLTVTSALREMDVLPEQNTGLPPDANPRAVLRYVLSANAPGRWPWGPNPGPEEPENTRISALAAEMVRVLRDYPSTDEARNGFDVIDVLSRHFQESPDLLSARDRRAIARQAARTGRMVAEMLEQEAAAASAANALSCRTQAGADRFGGPRDRSPDRDGGGRPAQRRSGLAGLHSASSLDGQDYQEEAGSEGPQGGAGPSQRQNAPGPQTLWSSLPLPFDERYATGHSAAWQNPGRAPAALRYLMRGCACALSRAYGGTWCSLSSDPRSCVSAMTYPLVRRWWDTLTEIQAATYMVERQFPAAGVEHLNLLFDSNLPVDAEVFDLEEYERRRSWMRARLQDGRGQDQHQESNSASVFRRRAGGREQPHSEASGGWDLSGEGGTRLCLLALREFYPARDLERLSDFPPLALQGGMPIVLTAKIVKNAHPDSGPLIELLHNRSPDSQEYEVCTAALALLSISPRLFAEIICQNWFDEPLCNWHKAFKDVLVRAKRSNIFGRVKGEVVLELRKFLSTTVRRKGDADLGVETRNRVYSVYPKTLLWYEPGNSPEVEQRLRSPHLRDLGWDGVCEDGDDAYMAVFTLVAIEMWCTIVRRLVARSYCESIRDHWAKRAISAPGGASTIAKRQKRETWDPRFASEDRISKKLVVELLPDNFLETVLAAAPINRAGYFVKPEPGKKLRALYSSYDHEMFLSSYASKGVENEMGAIPGVMVRQTPHDVLDWMAASSNKLDFYSPTQYWLSTDYSDYNSEHTAQEMAVLDASHALAWSIVAAADPKAVADKVAAADWIALSYSNSWICWGPRDTTGWNVRRGDSGGWVLTDGTLATEEFLTSDEAKAAAGRKLHAWSRVFNGLYSGHRDTARNNTLIHAIDMEIAKLNLAAAGVPWRVRFHAVCGDDEDVKFECPLDAALYYNTLAPAGHHLNPAKQLGGENNHEFLQLVWTTTVRVEKPLCALLSTLGTGNWYTQLGLWIQSAISSCIANWWEAHCRGLELGKARRLCAEYLDQLMWLPPKVCAGTEWEASGKLLEWWAFRNDPSHPPLYAGTAGDSGRMPRYEAVPEPDLAWPRAASEAYVRAQKPLLAMLPKDFSDELLNVTQQDTVATCLKSWRQRDAKRWAARHWPERLSTPDAAAWADCTKVGRDEIDVALFRLSTPRRKRVLDESTVFARMGISMFIGRKMGGIRGLAGKLPPKQWSHATSVERESYKGNMEFFRLQTNLRAALSYWRVPHPKYHGSVEQTCHPSVAYVFMANASGKTHLKRTRGGVDDLDELWCDLYGAFREDYEVACPKSSFSRVSHVAREILTSCARSTGVLVGQLQPDLVQRAFVELNWRTNCAFYDPGEGIRQARMERRGWTAEKVQRRLGRASSNYAEAKKLGWRQLRTESELLAFIEENAPQRRLRESDFGGGLQKQRMEYVFDRTEHVTRQLQIIEEHGKEEEHPKVEGGHQVRRTLAA
nr:hypothetical protein [Cryptolin alternavirus 1]